MSIQTVTAVRPAVLMCSFFLLEWAEVILLSATTPDALLAFFTTSKIRVDFNFETDFTRLLPSAFFSSWGSIFTHTKWPSSIAIISGKNKHPFVVAPIQVNSTTTWGHTPLRYALLFRSAGPTLKLIVWRLKSKFSIPSASTSHTFVFNTWPFPGKGWILTFSWPDDTSSRSKVSCVLEHIIECTRIPKLYESGLISAMLFFKRSLSSFENSSYLAHSGVFFRIFLGFGATILASWTLTSSVSWDGCVEGCPCVFEPVLRVTLKSEAVVFNPKLAPDPEKSWVPVAS